MHIFFFCSESTSFLESDGLLISSDNGDIINITESSDGLYLLITVETPLCLCQLLAKVCAQSTG